LAGFRSLRNRHVGPPDPDEVLPTKVLPYMRQPLLNWLQSTSSDSYDQSDRWQVLCQMLKVDFTGMRPSDAVIRAINADHDLLLDLIDARLRIGGVGRELEELKLALYLGGSGWRINDSNDGLEQVVDDTVRAVARAAIDAANDSAAAHLANAWSKTFGKDRNATQAHAEMIRAVESAAIPVVTPNDAKATLGTIIGQVAAQGSLYTTSGASPKNDGVAGVVAMMKTLWQQQTDRHGANPTAATTQARVEFLLPLAAALVHAFSSGGVRRTKQSP